MGTFAPMKGVFGEFDPISDTVRLCQSGLQYSLEQVAQLEKSLGYMRSAYEEKVSMY